MHTRPTTAVAQLALGAMLCWNLTAAAQTDTIVSNVKPDVTTHGITLNGSFISGGPVATVPASQAKSMANGQCRFEMAYHMTNKGEVATSPSFRNRMLRNGAVVVQHPNQTLDAKESEVKTFDVYLQSGLNDFGLYLDSENQVAESDETNNFRVAKINLTGSCLDKVVAPAAPARKPGIEHEDIGIRRR
ncbi:MAG TPA: CARDB domain-containing protein [Acidiferrobacterales bacterium]|jgi:hypothetical protein